MAFILCQKDSYLKILETKVKKCVPNLGTKTEEVNFPKTRKFKPGEGFFVLLADTILFAEGGGQPSDCGFINGIPVLDVFRDETNNNFVWHYVGKAFTEDENVKVELNWERRYDFMQQHTGQHLISAVAKKLLNANTTSWTLNTDVALIDFDLKDVTSEELKKLEDGVNQHIREARGVKYLEFDIEDPNTKLPEKLTSRNLDSKIRFIRVVEIENLDVNTCCGTHLKSLAELQLIKFPTIEKHKGCLRLHFVSGFRTSFLFQSGVDREKKLNKILSTSPEKMVEIISKMQIENRDLVKEKKGLMADLASFIGENLARSTEKFEIFHRDEGGRELLSLIFSVVEKKNPSLILFLSSGSDTQGHGYFLLSGSQEFLEKHGKKIAEALEAKAGGKKFFEGKTSSIKNRHKIPAILKEILS